MNNNEISKWVVFVESEEQLDCYLKYPISKILIEEPHFSLRSTKKLGFKIDFPFLERIFYQAKSKNPNLKIVFNYDLILHSKDFDLAYPLLEFLNKISYDAIRLQDYGLAYYISKNYPHMKIEIASLTGNYNSKAILFFEELFPNLVTYSYPNELDYQTIKLLEQKSRNQNEIYFHGPLLILYTKRRLLKESDYAEEFSLKQGYYQAFLKEKKRYDQFFKFIDNHHGSLLFYSKEISLIEYFSQVIDLNIPYALIDLRDKSLEFISQFSESFFDIIENKLFLFDDFQFKKKIQEIKNLYDCSLTEGFFLKNKTDIISKKVENNENNICLGQIVSVIKEKIMAVKVRSDFSLENFQLIVKTPGDKKIKFYLKFIKDVNYRFLSKAFEGSVVFINAPKGVTIKSLLYI